MTPEDTQRQAKSLRLGDIVMEPSDPWLGNLRVLPNPDPVLRKLGMERTVYDAIQYDPHVLGELRSIRAGLLSFDWRIVPGGDDAQARAAHELILRWMAETRPMNYSHWPDTIWTMATAVFRGWAIHQLGWERQDQYILPGWVADAPDHRYILTEEQRLNLLTPGNMLEGEETHPLEYVVTRHMPSRRNPYGVAVFSACFWSHVLKTNGWKWFEKLAKRHSIPWVIGHYPLGTPEPEQEAMVEGLAAMVEDAVAGIPEGGAVELLETKSTGDPVSLALIQACNREQSKALTSQTLATEQGKNGSRSATETHKAREDETQITDREMIAWTFNEVYKRITWINIGPNATPPKFEFQDQRSAPGDWVDVLDKARNFVPIGQRQALELLQLPPMEKDDTPLPKGSTQSDSTPPTPPTDHNRPTCHHDHTTGTDPWDQWTDQAAAVADRYLDAIPEEVRALAHRVDTLEELRDQLLQLYPKISDQRLGEHTAAVLMAGLLNGSESVEGGVPADA